MTGTKVDDFPFRISRHVPPVTPLNRRLLFPVADRLHSPRRKFAAQCGLVHVRCTVRGTETPWPQTCARAALDYHELPTPGKLQVTANKPLANQHDLGLAYSPGVAFACEEIARDPSAASRLTIRANLVGVITNGTAVLGLGNIGPLASKPVMEGKAVLFKKFAGIDCFDIEVAENEPGPFIEAVARLEPTFGGINLEDIKAPECFEIEEKLRARMQIPVFHDDQHGTAIVVAAGMLNALKLTGKRLRGREAGRLRRGRGGALVPQPAGQPRLEAREHHHPGHRRHRLSRAAPS